MNKNLILLIGLSVLLAGPATAQEQHRRPNDIKQYLEHLDNTERDRDQKPSQVIEALRVKPGMAIADLGSGSGYFTRRFVEAVTDTGMVYAVDVELEMLAYAKDSIVHMHVPYTAEFILARPDSTKLPFESVDLLFVSKYHPSS
jgi:arsenite methyltransferase